jgi:hypothetical protein
MSTIDILKSKRHPILAILKKIVESKQPCCHKLQVIDYERTGHYRIYKDFMADPKKYVLTDYKIEKEN